MEDLNNNILNNNIAEDTSNILIPDGSAIKSGIVFKSNINSNILNGYLNILSKATQYLQFTVGLYNKEANYNEGNIASLVIKDSENYSIWQFKRNSNNPQVLNNNPPITGASITTVNGVDIYEGGTLNTDWDKLTENYDVEATSNTVMIRDEKGASNVNMPSNIEDTTVVNNKYLEEQLQAGLSTKQDKLTAGTNVEITEDNVINVKGDVATAATQVTQTNEALGENVQTALDILNTNILELSKKVYPIGSVYIQYAEEDGTFDDNKSPENLFGGTWELKFANEGVAFITEGGYSNENRVNGVQGEAIKPISGHIDDMIRGDNGGNSGVLGLSNRMNGNIEYRDPGSFSRIRLDFDLSKSGYPIGSNIRMKNRQKRIYERVA